MGKRSLLGNRGESGNSAQGLHGAQDQVLSEERRLHWPPPKDMDLMGSHSSVHARGQSSFVCFCPPSCCGAGAARGTLCTAPLGAWPLTREGEPGAPGKGCSSLRMLFKEYQGTERVHLSYCVR